MQSKTSRIFSLCFCLYLVKTPLSRFVCVWSSRWPENSHWREVTEDFLIVYHTEPKTMPLAVNYYSRHGLCPQKCVFYGLASKRPHSTWPYLLTMEWGKKRERERKLPINSFKLLFTISHLVTDGKWKTPAWTTSGLGVKKKEEQKRWGLQPHSALNSFTQ